MYIHPPSQEGQGPWLLAARSFLMMAVKRSPRSGNRRAADLLRILMKRTDNEGMNSLSLPFVRVSIFHNFFQCLRRPPLVSLFLFFSSSRCLLVVSLTSDDFFTKGATSPSPRAVFLNRACLRFSLALVLRPEIIPFFRLLRLPFPVT